MKDSRLEEQREKEAEKLFAVYWKCGDKNYTKEDIQNYWKNKTQWIDSELNSKEDSLTDEEYYKQQLSIRELMELNMVMYGKW